MRAIRPYVSPGFESLRDPPGPSVLNRIALVFGLLIAATGCGAFGNDNNEPDLWSPFHSQSTWITEDGSIRVDLTGFERGHERGRESTFSLEIDNRKERSMDLIVCFQLIDEERVVQDLELMSVTVPVDVRRATDVTVLFDEDLEPRAYGLAVVIQETGAIVHTVRLGIADDEAGPWLDADELRCD